MSKGFRNGETVYVEMHFYINIKSVILEPLKLKKTSDVVKEEDEYTAQKCSSLCCINSNLLAYLLTCSMVQSPS